MPTIEDILRARKQQELLEKAKEQASSRERLLGSEDELWRWITDQFRLLPRRQRDCYARLWDGRLLSCGDKHAIPRSIADYSTRL